jgi:hypothetical protein
MNPYNHRRVATPRLPALSLPAHDSQTNNHVISSRECAITTTFDKSDQRTSNTHLIHNPTLPQNQTSVDQFGTAALSVRF